MASVHRVGKRVSGWLFLPLALAVVAGAVFLWPKEVPATLYLLAKQDLPAGATVTEQDFDRVTLPSAIEGSNYLAKVEPDSMLTRSVFKGELLAGAAVAANAFDRRTPVVIVVSGKLSNSVRVGSTVDVWAANLPAVPAAIVLDATVLAIEQTNSLGKTQTSAELAVSSEYIEALMQAKANGSFLELLLQPTLADQ